jgi:flagellar M-ring protein FliF
VAAASYLVPPLLEEYHVLFSGLSPEDAGAVVEALRSGRVPYRVGASGQVLVPAARVHEWRMKLASQGVPAGGAVGFEIFDKSQFGLTDFSQRLNLQRALQGELARTIGQLREVQQARVHLAMPTPRVFASQDKPPSASVVLRLRPGATLRPEQVRGIVHLVTSAVEGLVPDRVTVVDTNGRVLASGQERANGLSGNQLEARATVEQEIERRIQGLLDPIVGPGRSAVRVAAVVSFDQVERTQERFDPNPLVRSQSKSSEKSEGESSQPVTVDAGERPAAPARDKAAAPAGDKAPAPAGDKPSVLAATSANRATRDSEQTTYDIARTVERTVVAPGEVRRLSVGVILDVPTVNGARTPRPDAEIERIKRLVASAAGVRADRQDELEILQIPFDPGIAAPGDAPAAPVAARPAPPSAVPLWAWGAGGGVALVVIALVVWRARRRRTALENVARAAGEASLRPTPAGDFAPTPPAGPVSPLDLTPRLTEQDELRARVLAAAKQHPDEMAQIVRGWMVKRRPTSP